MAKQNINVGTAANDKKGDSLRAAFQKVNANFTELYEAVGLAATGQDTALTFLGSTLSTDDSSSIVIDRATTVTSNLSVGGDLLPQTANGGDLGSSTLPWRSLYVSNNTIFLGGVPLTLDANNNLTVNGSRVGTTSYADLSDKPTSFSSLVNGAQTVSLSSSPVSGTTFSSGLTIHRLSGSMANITSDINKVLQIATQTSNGRQEWSFGTDGILTLPQNGSIKSSTDIDITIDTPDSSTFNWQFGADGGLTFPEGYLKIVPNGANPYISNRIDNGVGLVSGSVIQIRQSVADAYGISINSSITDTSLGGGASLAGGSNIDVNGSKIILAKYTSNYLDADTGLTGQNKIEINDNSILIGLDVLTFTSGTTTSAFSGWTFDGQADTLTFPDNTVQTTAYIPGDIRSETGIYIDINLSDSTLRRWQFGEDGILTLPQGGNISEGGGLTGAIRLTPAGGANANQALLIYPTGFAEGDHLHLTAGGGSTELYLGDDNHYVKLANDGFVIIKADDGVNSAVWGFSPDGTTSIPGDIKSDSNINIDINLTDSTLRRWQFGEDGYLTLPNDRGINSSTNIKIELPNSIPSGITNLTSNGGWNQGSYTNLATTGGTGTGLTVNAASQASNGYLDTIAINTAGSGYTNGDVITITNENFLTATFTVTVPAANTWTFGENGRTTFPNGAVPVHSYGVAGDKEGMVAFDDTYIYYCTADYVNNISDIWKRVAWSGSTW